jgi:hypothetical protein
VHAVCLSGVDGKYIYVYMQVAAHGYSENDNSTWI